MLPPEILTTLSEAARAMTPPAMAGALTAGTWRPESDASAWLRAVTVAMSTRPGEFEQALARFYEGQLALWEHLRHASKEPPPDHRAEDWSQAPWFAILRRQHDLWVQWVRDVRALLELGGKAGRRLDFLLRQGVEVSDPDNHFATNPQAIARALSTGGDSVQRGLANLADDLRRGRISLSDRTALKPGRDLATTPGAVVHESMVAQLIQYRPVTTEVHRRPLLIVPPFINRFYVLDLRPENSLIRFALEQGFQVFLISWRNACDATASSSWDDYVRSGVIESVQVASRIADSPGTNLLGYCVGGTLAATAAAVLGEDSVESITSLSLLATLLDFSDAGEIGAFIDDAAVRDIESKAGRAGIVRGSTLALGFASLRARELIWHFARHNYLLGETPPANDLLHWNEDAIDVPGPLFSFYLRHMYLDNALARARGLEVMGRRLDLGRCRIPAYGMAARGDHIVPWQAAFRSFALLGGRRRFVVTEGGHVGAVATPGSRARGYWTGRQIAGTAEGWFDAARMRPGSWRTDWARWLSPHAGDHCSAPASLGATGHPPLEPAPGRYVLAPAIQT
ncbi:MAG: alpha/beta fold hydrolase [Betaproteobacteria bacterium]